MSATAILPSTPVAEAQDPDLREDGVFEMANLTEGQTGIEGIVYISTREGGHGPRVKYFVQPGRSQPSYSVGIADPPGLLVSSLPERVVNHTLPRVLDWVERNRAPLLDFWTVGDSWTDPQVLAFKAALQPAPR